LSGQRIDPASDGRPDPRPDVRETQPILGDLTEDFDFSQPPRQPEPLPVHPQTTLTGTPVPTPSSGSTTGAAPSPTTAAADGDDDAGWAATGSDAPGRAGRPPGSRMGHRSRLGPSGVVASGLLVRCPGGPAAPGAPATPSRSTARRRRLAKRRRPTGC